MCSKESGETKQCSIDVSRRLQPLTFNSGDVDNKDRFRWAESQENCIKTRKDVRGLNEKVQSGVYANLRCRSEGSNFIARE